MGAAMDVPDSRLEAVVDLGAELGAENEIGIFGDDAPGLIAAG